MNINIIYYSITNHSKKIALGIADNLNVKAINIKEDSTIYNSDILVIVGGIYANSYHQKLIDYVNKLTIDNTKNVIIVQTSNVKNDSEKRKVLNNIILDKKINILKEYNIKGSFLFKGLGHPSDEEIDNVSKDIKQII